VERPAERTALAGAEAVLVWMRAIAAALAD